MLQLGASLYLHADIFANRQKTLGTAAPAGALLHNSAHTLSCRSSLLTATYPVTWGNKICSVTVTVTADTDCKFFVLISLYFRVVHSLLCPPPLETSPDN